jgi:hypothetical protein
MTPPPTTLASAVLEFSHRWFIDPLDLHAAWWVLLLPMAFFIAMAYKAVRLTSLDRYWSQVAMMTAQIILGLGALALGFLIVFHVFARWWNG